ncbi:MAG: ABC transporter permease [Planctomycetota bacterium]
MNPQLILRQTWALFVDAYRELNARKLFWITMILSGLVVGIFAALGISDRGISIFGWHPAFLAQVTTDVIAPSVFYKGMFANLGIGLWLTWIATILALISTAGLIPELITGGSIETMLSKPIGRLRLFLTKYLTGLLFVALQVAVFSAGSFLVIGIRGGVWEPAIFLAIPIVVVFFSYLFSVCALLGLVTRSTIAALLLTSLCWAMLFVVNLADQTLVFLETNQRLIIEEREDRLELMERNAVRLAQIREHDSVEAAEAAGYTPTPEDLASANPFVGTQRSLLESDRESLDDLSFWTGLVVGLKTALPKTSETTALLERNLIDLSELPQPDEDAPVDLELTQANQDIVVDDEELSFAVQERLRSRSVWWIVGTSLIFEGVILAIAGLIFARRDF